MITTNELRQGNLVKHSGEGRALQRLKVIEIRRNSLLTIDLNGLVFGIGIEDAEGIPLTPEILHTVKFIYFRPGLNDYYFKIPSSSVIGIIDGKGAFKICASNSTAIFIKYIGFLHELQNLYFDLAGKELEFLK